MTGSAVGFLTSRLLRQALSAACGCAARRWKVEVSRNIGGASVRADIRSR